MRYGKSWVLTFVALSIAGTLFVGCSPFSSNTPMTTSHQTYSYGKFSSVDPSTDLHPGEDLTLKWEAVPGSPVDSSQPDKITLLAGLYGPFETVDELKGAMGSTHTSGRPPKDDLSDAAVGADPIETDTWSGSTYTSTLALPSNLPPGYYSLVRASVTSTPHGSARSESQTVLKVSAR